MKPTAVSQLIEALVKLAVGLSLAFYIFNATQNTDYASAAAIIGVSFSAFCGAAYLLLRKRKDRQATLSSARDSQRVEPGRVILKNLIRIAVPITIGSCLLFVLDLVDVSVIKRLLENYLTEKDANDLYGSWGSANKLFDLPGALTIPIATSLIPVIAAAFTQNDRKKVVRSAASAIRMTLLITVPCAVGFFLFGKPLSLLVYPGKDVSSHIIGMLLSMVSVAIIFNGLLYTTNSLMQAMGHVRRPVINMAIGGVVRIALNYVLVGNPNINIQGVAISSTISYLVTLILNLIAVYKLLPKLENILAAFIPTALAAGVMGVASYFSYQGLCLVLPQKMALIAAILVAIVVYFPAAILFRAIRKSELLMLPKGAKIAKIFNLHEGEHFG